jgi:hypothetical protein
MVGCELVVGVCRREVVKMKTGDKRDLVLSGAIIHPHQVRPGKVALRPDLTCSGALLQKYNICNGSVITIQK